jgi:spore germination protein KA/spore germination protein
MACAATMGGFGMMIFLLLVLLHLCKLRTLGEPYLAPLAPFRFHRMRDVLVRSPLETQLRKPRNSQMRKAAKSRG